MGNVEGDSRKKFRNVYKFIYLSRGRYRTNSRRMEDSIKIALLSVELSRKYLRVVRWEGWERVLEVI